MDGWMGGWIEWLNERKNEWRHEWMRACTHTHVVQHAQNRIHDSSRTTRHLSVLWVIWALAKKEIHQNLASGHSWKNHDKFVNCQEIIKFWSDLHENLSPDRFWPQDFDFWGPEGQFWKKKCQNYPKMTPIWTQNDPMMTPRWPQYYTENIIFCLILDDLFMTF